MDNPKKIHSFGIAIKILIAISDLTDSDVKTYVRVSRICKQTGFCETTVRSALNNLSEAGIVEKHEGHRNIKFFSLSEEHRKIFLELAKVLNTHGLI